MFPCMKFGHLAVDTLIVVNLGGSDQIAHVDISRTRVFFLRCWRPSLFMLTDSSRLNQKPKLSRVCCEESTSP